MGYPIMWQRFCQWLKENGKNALSNEVNLTELNRFAARFRLASNFHAFDAEGYNAVTKEAYGSLLGAFLAYSALEQFHIALKTNQKLIDRWGELDAATEHAASLRRAKTILTFLEKKTRVKELPSFIKGDTDNTLIIAAALRHAVAHGFMSVHANGTRPQTATKFCLTIKSTLLQIADDEFSKLSNSIIHKP